MSSKLELTVLYISPDPKKNQPARKSDHKLPSLPFNLTSQEKFMIKFLPHAIPSRVNGSCSPYRDTGEIKEFYAKYIIKMLKSDD
jgi:hypothetical protein